MLSLVRGGGLAALFVGRGIVLGIAAHQSKIGCGGIAFIAQDQGLANHR